MAATLYRYAYFFLFLIFTLASSIACSDILPKSEILSIEGRPEVFLINGEADAGYSVKMKVRNNGQPGKIHFEAKVTCSEGDFVRGRDLYFEKGEVQMIMFAFHEPTIHATDVRFTGRGWP